jgi:CRP-like cAMP-binding protein
MSVSKEAGRDLIGELGLFGGLTIEDRQVAANLCVWVTYGPDVEILGESERSTDIFFVVRGEVVAKSYSASGREVTFNTIGPGQMFGEFSAIDGQPRSASVRTARSTVIARMSSPSFRDFLARHPGVALAFAEHLVGKIRGLSKRVFEFSTLPVRYRIRAELLRMCQGQLDKEGGASIDPAPTHYELATRLSTHREAVSRELSYLASHNVLALHWRRIRVIDVSRLEASIEAAEYEH